MKRGKTGRYETISVAGGERVRAFVPDPLPPKPPLDPDPTLRERLDNALLALGRLDSVTMLLPDTRLFLYSYVRKEAVLSSQIEGTQSSLSDLLVYEIDQAAGVPFDDVVEVSSYVAAMEHGLARIREGFPISSRLLREVHGVLLSRGRGADKTPGEFRQSQNWIGGARPGTAAFIPPPAHLVGECMSSLEKFIHDHPARTPTVIKAALSHVQFETVHPFLDGNGRVGRLLITLMLCAEGVLRDPLLYVSLYIKKHRRRYYELLDGVRIDGNWEGWLEFFAEAVVSSAESAVSTARELLRLFAKDRARIERLGRAGSALQVHAALQSRPLATIAQLARSTHRSVPTVTTAVGTLQSMGMLREVTKRKRDRIFAYDRYLKILERDEQGS